MKPNYTIALSGLNAIDSPGPGVAVARGLKEAISFNVRLIGLTYESLEPGIFMHDLFDKVYHIPYPTAGTEVLKARIEYINAKENLDLIIPNFDAELYSFMKLESVFNSLNIKLFLPTFDQFEERHKVNLPDFGEKYGIDVPKSKAIFDSSELYKLGVEFSFPIVIKGKFYDASIAYNLEQANSFFNKLSSKWGLPIVVQEFVRGDEYNVTGLGDGEGNTIAAVPMRKQYITDKGKAWGGISIANDEMIDLTKHFIKQTKWRGGFELELMKAEDGTFYLIEINPRMPAWIYLAVGVGQNIPEALVNLALGNKVEPYTSFDVGKMFVRYAYDMIVNLEEFEKISSEGEL
jgi:carbamoyl-phosphate synthase large subunit